MKEYDVIIIGTGSAMGFVSPIADKNPETKIAIIDKDEPGGICLTRACIPSKLLIYPADLVRLVESIGKFGIDIELKRVDFKKIMERMRGIISAHINNIREGLSSSPNIDYYREVAEFIAPYTMKVGNETITSKMIFLGTGSKPMIPPVKGLNDVDYQTSDTLLKMTELPESMAIMGGGFISAEYAHFFSAMGTKVTIIGRNPRLLPDEEPEVSELAKKEMSKHMDIITNHEVVEVQSAGGGKKKVIAMDRINGKKTDIVVEEILVATGRASNTDILHPEKSGIKTDKKGWIVVNEYFETSQPDIWAFGDAHGKFLFKHVANYEARIVYYNAFQNKKIRSDYHAIPHAVFSHPEIAGVGLREKEAIEKYGEKNVLIGFYRYQDTAKGQAIGAKDGFVKVIVENGTNRILGAHIIGPSASVLIQEVINLMYTPEQSATPISRGMHIHPALSEVVEKAFGSLMEPAHYHHVLEEHLH
ncbi:dihydrolipoyl dehydrogenase [Candidatus Methanoperedens nitratireducens]|uniref:FAD-dependent pyridine nucleotide-disulfide oxidoreductase n=1 Tax=Candidatus Methanoperedens nitratireducens TaxID=1392998 RepID=A0A284VM70_9EURY|nr:dihydrolipoyl dehydrogenase [Candidatus Methanoperedens nitroreducens]SNQ60303.1 FAD-dependent pyridine nucleotide-disulfide oxidoreductase [Candidatus Methanoperedens nitroreducens]